jgi:radical SAM protein with 4Fe4S-binding SPASM domain
VERRCPYIEKETLVIRSDGAVSPCQEFMYTHPVYVNAHKKDIHKVIFGDAAKERIACAQVLHSFEKNYIMNNIYYFN